MLLYIVKVILLHAIFIGVYHIVFRTSGRHAINRFFLLSSFIFAFLIPVLDFDMMPLQTEIITPQMLPMPDINVGEQQLFTVSSTEESNASTYLLVGLVVITAISLFLLFRAFQGLASIGRLVRKARFIEKRWFSLYRISGKDSFTFLRKVFIAGEVFGTSHYDFILEHECEHARKLHTIDRIIIDFCVSLFWFNPFIHLYRNALIEVHEFEADLAALRSSDSLDRYQETLFQQLQHYRNLNYVSHFNVRLLKRRIVMMNKKKTASPLLYLAVVPLIVFCVISFSSRSLASDMVPDYLRDTSITGPIEDLRIAAESLDLQDYTPSIVPLQLDAEVEITSDFGYRTDPNDGKKRWHRGVDFRCPMRTPVLAPADGTVTATQDNPGGFGKALTLSHGEEYQTFFAHLDGFDVTEGQVVRKGQIVAFTGNSGLSKGPHLHYEVIKEENRVDPEGYMKNLERKYETDKQQGSLNNRQGNDTSIVQAEAEMLRKEAEALKRVEIMHAWGEQMIELQEEQRKYQEDLQQQEKALLDQQEALTEKQKAMLEEKRALEQRQKELIEKERAKSKQEQRDVLKGQSISEKIEALKYNESFMEASIQSLASKLERIAELSEVDSISSERAAQFEVVIGNAMSRLEGYQSKFERERKKLESKIESREVLE